MMQISKKSILLLPQRDEGEELISYLLMKKLIFKELIYSSKSISTKYVILKHLVKRVTARQLWDKVRTERRIASKGKGAKGRNK